VIAFARKQSKHVVTDSVFNCLHLYHTKNAAVLSFIGDNLDSPDPWIRRRAVEAVADLPLLQRSQLFTQLSRLSTDPNEPSEIRSLAATTLAK
jgi:hypothetical protein